MTDEYWSTDEITMCLDGVINACSAMKTYSSKEKNSLQLLLILGKELESVAKACMWGCAYALYPNLGRYPDLQYKIADALRCTLADMLQELSRALHSLKLSVTRYLDERGGLPEEADNVIAQVNQGIQILLERTSRNAKVIKEVIEQRRAEYTSRKDGGQ